MTKEKTINYLDKAIKDFSDKPEKIKYNYYGLCFYFKFKHKLKVEEIIEILGIKGDNLKLFNHVKKLLLEYDPEQEFIDTLSETNFSKSCRLNVVNYCYKRIESLNKGNKDG